jgi:hypothetical protein
MDLSELLVRPVSHPEESVYQGLMQEHHYLGALRKFAQTLWYVATWHGQWTALISFSPAAWKCAARDRWIGWDYRHQFDRLKLVVNNSRFLILPQWHVPNLGSRVLSLCQKRLCSDWMRLFGYPVVLMETFVDPRHFHGTVYKAANWSYVGQSKGYRRTNRHGASYAPHSSPKMVFLKPLRPDAQRVLSCPHINPLYRTGGRKMLRAAEMASLPMFFRDIPDPRRAQGKRHSLATVLAIAAGAILCGMKGYTAISDWAKNLNQRARDRFNCRKENGRFVVPSQYIIRDVLVRVDPDALDKALQRWNETYGIEDRSLAIDGKVMKNAIDSDGHQAHIMSAVGHQSKACHAQKKSASSPQKETTNSNEPMRSKCSSPCSTPSPTSKEKPSPQMLS